MREEGCLWCWGGVCRGRLFLLKRGRLGEGRLGLLGLLGFCWMGVVLVLWGLLCVEE